MNESISFFINDSYIEDLGIVGNYFVISNIVNNYSDEIYTYLEAERAKIDEEILANSSQLTAIFDGFKELHDAVGRSNKRFPASSVSLADRYAKKRELKNINPVVDIYNLFSLKSGLAIGAHDVSKYAWPVFFKRANGGEEFHEPGLAEPRVLTSRDYSYFDAHNEIICFLEVRQGNMTLVDDKSKEVFFIVQGNRNTTKRYIDDLSRNLITAIEDLCLGRCIEFKSV